MSGFVSFFLIVSFLMLVAIISGSLGTLIRVLRIKQIEKLIDSVEELERVKREKRIERIKKKIWKLPLLESLSLIAKLQEKSDGLTEEERSKKKKQLLEQISKKGSNVTSEVEGFIPLLLESAGYYVFTGKGLHTIAEHIETTPEEIFKKCAVKEEGKEEGFIKQLSKKTNVIKSVENYEIGENETDVLYLVGKDKLLKMIENFNLKKREEKTE